MTATVHAVADNYLISPSLHIPNGDVEAPPQFFPDPARRGSDADAVTGTQGVWIPN
jgi:hypothetical protein